MGSIQWRIKMEIAQNPAVTRESTGDEIRLNVIWLLELMTQQNASRSIQVELDVDVFLNVHNDRSKQELQCVRCNRLWKRNVLINSLILRLTSLILVEMKN